MHAPVLPDHGGVSPPAAHVAHLRGKVRVEGGGAAHKAHPIQLVLVLAMLHLRVRFERFRG